MKVYIVVETDHEWWEIKRVFDSQEKADAYIATSRAVNKINGIEYFYPVTVEEVR